MVSDGLLTLGFDTSAAHCAAALLSGDRVIEAHAEEMGRGQAERLMPMLEEMLARAGLGWRDLDRIGVGIGPGNFTGIRIAVSAARGLALPLKARAVGVSGFEAIALDHPSPHLPAIPGPRGLFYVWPPGAAPRLADDDEIAAYGLEVAGPPAPARLAGNIARIAARSDSLAPPAPLYVKPADAAPPREAPPVMLD